MNALKKGDFVARISYNKDILFEITRIIKDKNKNEIYILKGVTERIEADSPKEDLVKIDKRLANVKIKKSENKIYKYIERYLQANESKIDNNENKRKNNRIVYTGKILHLDGDKKYADKSIRYYKNLNLNAVVKNIPESKQPIMVSALLDKYKPDVVIVTRA